jgi:catechol 2,3-dioxygenase-like lactoylglutathione lyase family enzyme
MAVKRIVTNIAADRLDAAKTFYGDVLGLNIVMNLGWIMTFAAEGSMAPHARHHCAPDLLGVGHRGGGLADVFLGSL